MKVRVKNGMTGFYGGHFRREGQVFDIKAKQHTTKKGPDGKPLKISEAEQFSDNWMEQVKPGRKPLAETPEES